MKCNNPQCDNEILAAIAGHDLCVDCYRNTSPTPLTKPYQTCTHKKCNEPRLNVSRFCNLHYDEARATATGEGYDAIPNVTLFADTPEELERLINQHRCVGFVVIPKEDRRVGEGVEMRYVRPSPADEPLTATEILRRQQENDARLQSDIQAMQQRRSPLLDELVEKAIATGAFTPDTQGNKRADRNDFSAAQRMQGAARQGVAGLLDYAAPQRDGAVLELGEEKLYHLVCDLRAVSQNSTNATEGIYRVLRAYGIIGGAK